MEIDPRKDLEIDQFHLDREWMEQAGKYQRYAQLEAEAEHRKDKAKAQLDLVMAELDFKVRSNPQAYELKDKPNNDQVASMIVKQPEYQERQAAYFDAKREYNEMDAVVEAMGHKKQALENLVKLKLSGYFAEPKVPREEQDRTTNEEIKRNMEELNKEPVTLSSGRRRVSA